MTAYPDTSYLFNLYVPQTHTARASAHFAATKGPLRITSLNHFEIIYALQLALFRKTILRSHAQAAFAAVEDDLAIGATELVSCDWGAVHGRALRIARQHTAKGGHRGFDILHVATALELGAKEFLTFDSRQTVLAKAVGLKVQPGIA